ncbi:complement component receptor 1-like protein isoform X2 [Eucyclogobius newberryi]|uniref:complement component receptor 1-like protein isoform X2 n=1 Tax=Eucyclogobius newberryi TaxID=166745 RepID=UPI003B59E9E0
MKAFWMFLVFLGVARSVYGNCDKPTGKENMELITEVVFPAPDGTSVRFTCQVGYKPLGSGTVTCTNGQWSDLKMICEIKNCGSAEEVINGHVDYSQGTEFGAIIHVKCNEGYYAVGRENKMYCTSKGWEGRFPVCEVIRCDPPNQIANGYFSPVKEDYQFSEVVTYSCEGKYKINGSKSLVCLDNREFDKAPPTCVLVECPDPKIEFGIVAAGSRPPYSLLTSVTFRCNVGYDIVGSDSVSCDINSKWSPELPKCNPIECKAPEIKDGEVVDVRPTYKYSEKVTLKCSEGYKLTGGDSVLTCGEKSQWSGTIPQCTMIQCTAPKVEGGVLVDGSRPSYKYKDTVVFTCLSGHNMTGQPSVTCDLYSQWSPKLPECKSIECAAPDVKHGELEVGLRPSYKYLDSVRFKCKSGYTMNGASTLTCALNSQWSPELPQCTTSNILKIVLGVLGAICGSAVVGCCIYFGFIKKAKRSRKNYTEASHEGETLEL